MNAHEQPQPTPHDDDLVWEAPTEATPTPRHLHSNDTEDDRVVLRYAYMAGGSTVQPLGALRNLGLLRLQLRMLHELCRLHRVHYAQYTGQALIVALIGNLRQQYEGPRPWARYASWLPGLGLLDATLRFPEQPEAITYAVGRVFQRHFEHGGTLLNFSTTENEALFASALTEAKFMLG